MLAEIAHRRRSTGPPATNWARRCCRPTAAGCCRRSTSGGGWPSRAGPVRRGLLLRHGPAAGPHGLVDVLVGSHKGVECRFYFDPAEGDLLAHGDVPDEDSDPCEVYFSDYRDVTARSRGRTDDRATTTRPCRVVPGRMESPLRRTDAVRHAEDRRARGVRSQGGIAN